MASRNRRPASRHNSKRPLPVDELMVRHGGRPVDLPESGHPPVSVAALLRREGRGPHAADGDLRPRTHLCAADLAEPPPPRRQGRKVAAAAGAMFAIGALVGPSILNEAALPRGEAEWPRGAFAGTGPADGPAASGRVAPPRFQPQLAAMFIPDGAAGAPTSSTAPAALVASTPSALGSGAGGSGAGGSGAGGPGGGLPGVPTPPGGGTPGGGGPTPPPGGGTPGQPPAGGGGVTVPPPVVGTPPITVPPVVVPPVLVPPVVGPISTPGVGVSPVEVAPPAVTVTTGGGTVGVSTSGGHVTTPDVTTTGADVGPVHVTGGSATLPDVSVSGGSVTLTPAGPRVEVPDVDVSAAKVVTPDVEVGGRTVPLPDVELPPVHVQDVAEDPVAAVTSTVTSTLDGAGRSAEHLVTGTADTVGALLGAK